MISIETAAADREKSAGLPLQKENDRNQHHDFPADGRAGQLLQHLVGRADAQRGAHGADDAAHAAHNHGHKTVNDVSLAQARADVADLGEEGAGQARQRAVDFAASTCLGWPQR